MAKDEEGIETGNAITISADQISLSPHLTEHLDPAILNELVQFSFTYQVAECLANTLVFPVIPKKRGKNNKNYLLIGLIPFFCILERKGIKEFKVSIVNEPSSLDTVIGNTYQLMPLKRGNVANAVLAALVDHTNNSSEVRQSGMNFIEMENYNRNKKFKDPLETVTGFKRRGLIQTLQKEKLSESVISLLKELDIDIKKDVSPEDVEKQPSD